MSVVNRTAIDFNYQCALVDVQCQVNEVGLEVRIEDNQESTLARDKYRSISRNVSPTIITVYAYPADFNPNEKSIDQAGLKESVDVILWTPFKTWTDNNLTFRDIDLIRWEAIINGESFLLRDKALNGQLGSGYLYVVLGVSKE